MTEDHDRRARVRASLAAERSLLLSLGGYAFEVSGGTLLLHERIPVPRFNFVQVEALSPQRQTGFFERTLDQYFQRAIRPTFRVPLPVPTHIDRTLHDLGFRPRAEPASMLGRVRARVPPRRSPPTILAGPSAATDALVPFWSEPRDAPLLASAIEVLRHHPNPGETLVPVLATEEGRPVAAALVYGHHGMAFIFGVSTVPTARGRGVASALVEWILSHPPGSNARLTAILSERRRLDRHLQALGFRAWVRWRVYELLPDAELTLPPRLPSGGPLWRPPRGGPAPGSR